MEYKKNEDGTDILDEEGNPIPIEIVTDEAKEAAKVKEQLVEELKELRLKNGILNDLLKSKEPEVIPPKEPVTDEEKLEVLLDKKLKEREASNAQANKKAAFEKFVTDNKEFHPENDSLGLKRGLLEKKFAQFNTETLLTIDEFYSVIGDSKKLLVGNDNQLDISKGDPIPYSQAPTPKGIPPAKKVEDLTPKELKLAEQTGRTKEQILKIKLKHPDFLADLLTRIRD